MRAIPYPPQNFMTQIQDVSIWGQLPRPAIAEIEA